MRTHAIMDVGVWMSGGFENGTGLEVRGVSLAFEEERMKVHTVFRVPFLSRPMSAMTARMPTSAVIAADSSG